MTRAERKAQQKALQARVAIRVFAQMAAKNAVKASIRAQGFKVSHYSARDIALWAEVWISDHPEVFAEARAKAVKLGYC